MRPLVPEAVGTYSTANGDSFARVKAQGPRPTTAHLDLSDRLTVHLTSRFEFRLVPTSRPPRCAAADGVRRPNGETASLLQSTLPASNARVLMMMLVPSPRIPPHPGRARPVPAPGEGEG